MCVIMIVEKPNQRPDTKMIEKAWELNSDGGGIAHRDGDEVVWEKGLELGEMKRLMKTLPTPYVAHFRLKSIGGGSKQMTHPFPIDVNTSLALKGRTKGHVLFHNGTWKEWLEVGFDTARATGAKFPIGKWSDSRAIAWLTAIHGLGFMDFALPEQRGIAFGPKGWEVYIGPGWEKVNDIWCSNNKFLHFNRLSSSNEVRYCCTFGPCVRTDNIDKDGRCNLHPLAHPVELEVAPLSSAPFQPIMSLTEAERLNTEKIISNNLIKAFRKAYSRLQDKNQEVRKAAMKSLQISSGIARDKAGEVDRHQSLH